LISGEIQKTSFFNFFLLILAREMVFSSPDQQRDTPHKDNNKLLFTGNTFTDTSCIPTYHE